jgi:SWI/SNF-related matrix-associated actin-dependent regulator 1 of chromatin subfamily A
MTDFNLDDLTEDQLADLLEKKRAVKKAKEELDRLHLEAIEFDEHNYGLMLINNIMLIENRVHFSLHNGDSLKNHLFTYKSTRANYGTEEYNLDIKDWTTFTQNVANATDKVLKRVAIVYSGNVEDKILNYKSPPDYLVEIDSRTLKVKLGPNGNSYNVRDIPGCQWDSIQRAWRIPYAEGWRFIENQIAFRLKLDEIAVKETSDFYPTLGGFTLRGYQQVGVEFLAAAEGKVILAPEMGLGKTPIGIAYREYLHEKLGNCKCLIVPPASLKINWERQIKKFTGSDTYTMIGSTPTHYDVAKLLTSKDGYFIINYDILATVTPYKKEWVEDGVNKIKEEERRLWVDVLNKANFDLILVDEAHYIKNPSSQRSQAVRELKANHGVIPITGTPLMNYPNELWAILSLVRPEIAGPYETFVNQYTIDGKRVRNAEELRQVLKPVMFRRTKKDVLKELPPINRIYQPYELTTAARAAYVKAEAGLWIELDEWESEGAETNPQAINGILAQIIKLKQICAWDKVSYIADLATELYDQSENGHRKVLIFSQFAQTPAVVPEIAKRLGDEALHFTGEQQPHERMALVDRFQNDPNIHFLVCSIKAAAEGLDITAAGHVITVDPMWNPGIHQQAEGRAYGRLSDLHSVDAYYVQAVKTIEDWIYELIAAKLDIFNEVVEGTEASRNVSIVSELLARMRKARRAKDGK